MDAAALADELRATGLSAGLDAVGFASAAAFPLTRDVLEQRKAAGLHAGMHFTYGRPERSTTPAQSLDGARSLVVAARSYRRAEPPKPMGPAVAAVGAVARYSWQDHYAPLRRGLALVAAVLEREGHRARVLVDDNALVDRAAAVRAGLGWFGRNANVLLAEHGSWFVLGSVVTDAELPSTDQPVDGRATDAGCGSCAACLPACPTGALVAPGVLDARRCLAWLLEAPGSFPVEHRAALGGRIYGCDECQLVCPVNRLGDRRDPPPPADAGDEAWVDLVALLEADDATLTERFGRWYIPRRQPRFLRRNALVALGNVGDGGHPAIERVLRAAIDGDDELLREHAGWAAARLGRSDLLRTPA